jgi:hypothetical protein
MDTREAGAMGGRSRSATKRASSARNLQKARSAKRTAVPAPVTQVAPPAAGVPARPAAFLVVPK